MTSHIIRRPRRRRLPYWLTVLVAALPLGVAIGVGVVANIGG